MSYTQRRSLFGLLLTLVLMPLYYFLVIGNSVSLDLNVPIDFTAWAWIFVNFFIILIISRIVLTVLHFLIEFFIQVGKHKNEDKKEVEISIRSIFAIDERYKNVDLKASSHIGSIITFGFLLSMVLILMGVGPSILFFIMYVSMGLSGLMIDGLSIYLEARS